MKMVAVHKSIAGIVSSSKIKGLKLAGIAFFDQAIEEAWSQCMLANTTIKHLTLSNKTS